MAICILERNVCDEIKLGQMCIENEICSKLGNCSQELENIFHLIGHNLYRI